LSQKLVFYNFFEILKMNSRILPQPKGTTLQQKPISTLHPWVRRVGQALTVLNLSLAVSSNPVWAMPIVPNADGTNTNVNRTGNQFDITGGTRSRDGRNLFHSFKDFNLDAGQVANFVSNSKIQSILGRINGGNASVIDGLLKVSGGKSNLFLLNPSGIVFGKNATLDVPAAFTATTANGIQFGSGWFSATGTDDLQALKGAPVGFAFSGAQPGAIVNLGDLTVGSGQNLTLLGGTVASTGSLAAPDGQVTVSAVPGTSYVRLSQSGQFLSLEVKPLSMSATLPNAGSLTVASLPQLLTGAGADSATELTVNPDGTVQLTGSTVTVNQGDVTVKTLNAGTATITAANTLSLVESQIATAKDLRLSGQMVTVRDGEANPVSVQAGGNLSVHGDRGIDIFALNHPGSYAFGSGGDLSFLSHGIISGDAHFKSGGNLFFRNLGGGSGKFVSLFDPVLYSGGDVDLGSYTGTSLKVEAGGNILAQDITITGADVSGGIPVDDPDYKTLTESSALILRGGLSEPASIISVGNIRAKGVGLITNGRAKGSIVELTTNGNIFTGNIDVSSDEGGQAGGTIKLKAFNIFTGDLNASSTSSDAIRFRHWDGWGARDGEEVSNIDKGGSISIEAGYLLRTGDLDVSSKTSDGGVIDISAADWVIGATNVSMGKYRVFNSYIGGYVYDTVKYQPTKGTVTIKDPPIELPNDPVNPSDPFGSSTEEGDPTSDQSDASEGSEGDVAEGAINNSEPRGNDTLPVQPPSDSVNLPDPIRLSTAGSDPTSDQSKASGAIAGDTSGGISGNSEPIGSNSLPPDDTNAVYPPASLFIPDSRSSFSNQDDFVKNSLEETQSEDGLDSPEAVRRRILTFLEARQLAGEKWTAQAIAQKLDIPLEIAQIAVLNPIGQNIKVPEPDLTALHKGTLVSQRMGDFSSGSYIDCGILTGLCQVVVGGIIIVIAVPVKAAINLWNNIFQSKSKDVPKDNGEDNGEQDQELSPEGSDALTPKEKARIRNLEQYKDKTAAEAIRARGGGQGQVKELQSGYGEKTVAELAKLAAKGDEAAETALKIIKQAGKKKQKYGGK
jgi:filamentous hemagglutinin family protein